MLDPHVCQKTNDDIKVWHYAPKTSTYQISTSEKIQIRS